MRGFTALADSLAPHAMIDLLNRYFDCQVPVILDHGAEVLKFMGDGLLAIFAIADDEPVVCKRALAAARGAQANIAALASSAIVAPILLGSISVLFPRTHVNSV
jgi:adenylate cyclase